MLVKNDVITLKIDGFSCDGAGVGRYEGLAVFVPCAAPGDTAEVLITKVLSNRAYGKITALKEPSPHRIPPDCDIFQKCGGCAYRHISYETELSSKLEAAGEALRRIGQIDIRPETIIPSPLVCGYRNKAQLPFGIDADGRIYLGFYANRSHRIVKTSRCINTPQIFAGLQKETLDFANRKKLSVYDEGTGKGLLRHIYLRYGEKTGEIMLCLVINGRSLPHAKEFTDDISRRFPDVKSIILNVSTEKTNVITGGQNILLHGEEFITDIICGLKVKISPDSFYQINRSTAEAMYYAAADALELSGAETLLDLYCGTGTIGLSMAKRCAAVIGVEQVQRAVDDACGNALANNIANASFFCADAGKAYSQIFIEAKPDVVVIDPPRKGCSPLLINHILQLPPEKLLYISCDPATLARDLRVLTENVYSVTRVFLADMFPRTYHVECVVLLSKR